ncbi:MAG: stage III sporulation protein AD [Limnochordales bacterium]|nr:stage III sporulation protein AD [Limnochordales bacterium]
MEDLGRIVGAGLVVTILLAFLRERYPALAVQLMMAFVAGVLLLLMPALGRVLGVFADLGRRAQVHGAYLDIALRVIGVAYLTAFGAQICRDAKEEALASVIELAGKVVILLLALPVVMGILDALLRLLP